MKGIRALSKGSRFALALAVVGCAALLYAVAFQSPLPLSDLKWGTSVTANAKAGVDCSNLAEGLVRARYTGGGNVRIKVQIAKEQGTTYTYNLNSLGNWETFPLAEGDGNYSVKVYMNTSGTKYALALSCPVQLKLRGEFLPFLYPNQYVNYAADSKVTVKAAELTKGMTSDLDKLSAVYSFVVDGFTYDKDKAATVKSGYLPVVDEILASKKGICFDYAAVMASMLRSQGVPCKLIVGYAGTIYHAWINVYIEGQGWIEKAIYFDGNTWTLMDPTFASSGKNNPDVIKYIGDGSNYTQKYAY